MRLALIAPPFIPIPPMGYGGTELFLAGMIQGLKQYEIDVVLYSNGESTIEVENRWIYSHSEWPIRNEISGQLKDLNQCSWAIADAAQSCDIIHVNSSAAVAFSRMVQRPMVCTLHHPHVPEMSEFYLHYPEIQYVAISKFQEQQEEHLPRIRTIYHGLDCSQYRLQCQKQDYLCFLSRIAPIKGTHLAIEVAKLSGIPLKIAGDIQPIFRDYYESCVKPHVDGRFIEYVGEADLETKNQLLGGARALLFPIQWDEPFGLVMIEALACGTPVLALPGGSVSEIVIPGISGAICSNVQEMAQKAKSSISFDPQQLRQFVEHNFCIEVMVEKYVALYRELLRKGNTPRPKFIENVELRAA